MMWLLRRRVDLLRERVEREVEVESINEDMIVEIGVEEVIVENEEEEMIVEIGNDDEIIIVETTKEEKISSLLQEKILSKR